jgi:hypothetical protein
MLKQKFMEGVCDTNLWRELRRVNETHGGLKFFEFRQKARDWIGPQNDKSKKTSTKATLQELGTVQEPDGRQSASVIAPLLDQLKKYEEKFALFEQTMSHLQNNLGNYDLEQKRGGFKPGFGSRGRGRGWQNHSTGGANSQAPPGGNSSQQPDGKGNYPQPQDGHRGNFRGRFGRGRSFGGRANYNQANYNQPDSYDQQTQQNRAPYLCFLCGSPKHFVQECPENTYNKQEDFKPVPWQSSVDQPNNQPNSQPNNQPSAGASGNDNPLGFPPTMSKENPKGKRS